MTQPIISRRLMLHLVSGGVAASVVSWPSSRAEADVISEALLSVYPHRESAERVGGTLLAMQARHRDRDRLVATLSRDLDVGSWARLGRSPAILRTRIRRRIRDDARHGRLIHLDGATLSVTEARLCMLAYLCA